MCCIWFPLYRCKQQSTWNYYKTASILMPVYSSLTADFRERIIDNLKDDRKVFSSSGSEHNYFFSFLIIIIFLLKPMGSDLNLWIFYPFPHFFFVWECLIERRTSAIWICDISWIRYRVMLGFHHYELFLSCSAFHSREFVHK